MHPRLTSVPRDEQADRIRRLEDALFAARQSILQMAPEELHTLLQSFYSCKTRAESYQWEGMVADQVVDGAVPIADGVRPDVFGERAYCPLCRGGARSYYPHEKGFSHPEGLRRHLVGFGKTNQCPVMKAAHDLAWETWNRSFSEREGVEAAAAQRALDARRKTEPVYIIGPTADGLLLDEGLFWKNPRSLDDGDHSLKWAEQRLFALGFQIGVDGQRRSYTKTVKHREGEFVIYADPRQLGDIHFRVFDASIKRGKRAGLALAAFRIRDAWKNNLPAKISAGVEDAAKAARR